MLCYAMLLLTRRLVERSEAIAKLKQHTAELKRLGVEHLYLFGSTARGETREDSDVDLFFDHPQGSLGLFALMGVKEAAARNPWAQNRYHDAAQLGSGSARADRGLRAADILMAKSSPIACHGCRVESDRLSARSIHNQRSLGRAWPGHPRLPGHWRSRRQDVDARNKSRQRVLTVVSRLVPFEPALPQLLNRTAVSAWRRSAAGSWSGRAAER
jgi:Nucleotidyltransferase domain